MGAVFRTQPQCASRIAVVRACRERGVELIATALSAKSCDIRQVPLDRAAVVIGSEGRGVSAEFLAETDRQVIIPMNARCESLNAAVAATIVMWQMKR